ncbi:MAG: hypothetical protein N2544_04760 [Burkholderiales bacterium]|nr:hypothetical protein [Burkholderiales bacterium]
MALAVAAIAAGCNTTVSGPGGYSGNRTSPFLPFEEAWRPPPAMDEGRRIEHRDCAKPLDGSTGNLRCQ